MREHFHGNNSVLKLYKVQGEEKIKLGFVRNEIQVGNFVSSVTVLVFAVIVDRKKRRPSFLRQCKEGG